MNPVQRLCTFGAAVVLLAVGAFAVGSAVEPPATAEPDSPTANAAPAPAVSDEPAGLASTRDGYTFVPAATTLPSGTPTELAFRITGPDGGTVTAFDVEHEKRMHLILVRRDTSGFQHVHPTLGDDGTWRVPVTLATGGAYRAFADFAPTGGAPVTLGTDLFAPGRFTPASPAPSRTATLPDGYAVRLDGDLVPGRSSPVTLTVTRDGRPVDDLQPYLGAYGHLVALRGGDLAYLHVHPDGTPGDGVTAPGPGIRFHIEVPSTGTYRLFLDLRHDGQVRTAAFTIPAAGSTAPVPEPGGAGGHGHDGGH
ncbi:hypothetical protein [Pseudonocardia endophytica]|uniref:Secreted protein n=1 Tax=Pseudonocardia endophytica TaxID=401976 RepID=A0A4R1HIV3_PSEEN|nr:hypothetical protein [Pseudonocardia endophytica]TCK21758.1 hypothetical protein EV378_5749 [Pseudonocardia endophytica]